MALSHLIMKLALRNVPADREDWADAMQAEFEMLDKGRMNWALGCLATGMRWYVGANALYLIALPATVAVVEQFLSGPLFWLIANHCPQTYDYCTYTPYYSGSLEYLVPCIAFGFWRPRLILTTAVVMTLSELGYTYLFFALAMGVHNSYIHFMNMPPVIGETVMLVAGGVGAATGALLRQGARRIIVRRR